MRIHRLGAAAALFLLLTGCLPVTTTSPVGTTAGPAADPALLGTWKVTHVPDNKEPLPPVYLHFLREKPGTMTALYVGASGKDSSKDDGWMAFDCTTAVLGTHHILNAVYTAGGGDSDGGLKGRNIPFLYTLKGRTLTLYWLDEDKTKEAVKAGAIEGKVQSGDLGDVEITAGPKDLDAFFAKPEAKKLFTVMMVLKKVD